MTTSPKPTAAALLRRQRVHQAVRELMAEQGFRVSMDAVAARAGCSKQTLYTQFGSKQALMRSVMQERLDLATARMDDPDGDPRTVLLSFAVEHLRRLADPTVVATCQLLGGQAHQFPEEARALYNDGWEPLEQRLADWLHDAMRRGQLRRENPRHAAELLLGMIIGLDFERQRFAFPHRGGEAAQLAWAEFATDAFLRAFSPDPTHDTDTSKTSPES